MADLPAIGALVHCDAPKIRTGPFAGIVVQHLFVEEGLGRFSIVPLDVPLNVRSLPTPEVLLSRCVGTQEHAIRPLKGLVSDVPFDDNSDSMFMLESASVLVRSQDRQTWVRVDNHEDFMRARALPPMRPENNDELRRLDAFLTDAAEHEWALVQSAMG